MDTRICMAESLCYSPETITTLLISCTPIQYVFGVKKRKKIKKKKKEEEEASHPIVGF